MGTGEEITPVKSAKTSSTQETPPIASYADWSTSMQAYYGAGAAPPQFFASNVASTTPHPYMWGSQHPLMPAYGPPIPYPALYPSGGIYAHPNMVTTPVAMHTNVDFDEKILDEKEQISTKRSKGTSSLMAGESAKMASGSGNDGDTLSAESGSEGSSVASDENTNQKESAATKKGSFDQMLVDGANAQNSSVGGNLSGSVQGKPAPNLNIRMELWNGPSPVVGAAKMRHNSTGVSLVTVAPAVVGREVTIPDQQWVQQDERELKRQKRKQSNRESARRSRLRKQAECEDLQIRVETLSNDNLALKDELRKLAEECKKLTSQNISIKDELLRKCGPNALSNLENGNSQGDGENSN